MEAWAREGTSKAANRFNSFELQAPAAPGEGDPAAPKPGEVGGPADESGVRRTKTGWRRILGGDGGAVSDGGTGGDGSGGSAHDEGGRSRR